MTQDPKCMDTATLITELNKHQLVTAQDADNTPYTVSLLSETARRLEFLDQKAKEHGWLKEHGSAVHTNTQRSLELIVNDLVSIQHPDPISMLFDQIKLMAQTTRMLDAESFSKVTGKLQAMRAFSDVIDFRHALMNLCVVLKISDQGDVEVSYRGRPAHPVNMMLGGHPNVHNMLGPSVFGPGPHFNGAGGMEPGVINQPYRGRNGNLKPLITLPITALFSLKATDGDNGFKTITVVDGLMPDVVYPPQAAGPVEILSSLIEQNGNNRYLIEVMERVHKGEVVAEIDIFARGFAPTLRVSPNTY